MTKKKMAVILVLLVIGVAAFASGSKDSSGSQSSSSNNSSSSSSNNSAAVKTGVDYVFGAVAGTYGGYPGMVGYGVATTATTKLTGESIGGLAVNGTVAAGKAVDKKVTEGAQKSIPTVDSFINSMTGGIWGLIPPNMK